MSLSWRAHLVIIAPVLALFVLHMMATYWHWYYFNDHFDTPMHLFGGAAVGWVTAHVCRLADVRLSVFGRTIVLAPIVFAILMAALVGIGWEWYEFFKDFLFSIATQPSIGDTMKDLALDVFGGMLGGVLAYDARRPT